jgi:hypothetical protein
MTTGAEAPPPLRPAGRIRAQQKADVHENVDIRFYVDLRSEGKVPRVGFEPTLNTF